MEREKNRKLASVTIERVYYLIERVIKKLTKPGNSRIIMKLIEKLWKRTRNKRNSKNNRI